MGAQRTLCILSIFLLITLAGCPLRYVWEPPDGPSDDGGATPPDLLENETVREYVESCRANTNTVCLPDQHWRCWNYDVSAKDCDYIVGLIRDGEQPQELCYELGKPDLEAYCLSKANLTLCYEYAESDSSLGKICALQECILGAGSTSGERSVCYDDYRGYSPEPAEGG